MIVNRGIYKNDQETYSFSGMVEQIETGERFAVLKSFRDGKTFVMNLSKFEKLVESGEFVKEGVK